MKTRNNRVRNILESIGSITREFNSKSAPPFGQLPLGRPLLDVLFIVSEEAPLSVKELSEKLHVTSGAVTQFIGSLEGHGLVEKSDNPHDKRGRLIDLTETARQELDTFKENYVQTFGGAFSGLTQSELKTLDELLRRVRNKRA
jgi:MarR family 2-MHQ and catechol resistance regulon transcriptional repressor